MKNNSLIKNLSWSFAEKILTDIINTLVTIVLARLLFPEDYGLIALVQVFINVSLIFVNCGMCTSLIQNKDATEEQISTVFYINAIFGIIIYVILFFISPYIAEIKGNKDLILLLRVLSIQIPIASIYSIQHAYIQKRMEFKKFFFSSLFGTLFAGIVGITMAYKGFGVWSLVASTLIDQCFDCIILFFTSKWLPKFKINFKSSKNMIFFGIKILFIELITRLSNNIRSLTIGFKYTEKDLAYNSKGLKFPQMISNTTNSIVIRVLFPVMSKLQTNKEDMKDIVSKNVQLCSYVIVPMMFGLASVSYNFVPMLLTEKWIAAIPYIQIYCLIYTTNHISAVCTRVTQACGEGNIFMKQQVSKIVLDYLIIVIAIFTSKDAVSLAISGLITQIIDLIIDVFVTHKLINYGFKDLLKDTSCTFISSMLMCMIVMFVGSLINNYLIATIIQVLTGIIIYLVLSILLRNKSFSYIYNFLKNRS